MLYSKEMCDVLCQLIIEGHALRTIGKVKGLPSKATMLRWLKDPRKIDFLDAYRRAKELQHWNVAEEIIGAVEGGAHWRSLGQWGGRVHKLHLKANARARGWLAVEDERRARLRYAPAPGA